MLLGQQSVMLRNLSTKVLIDSPIFCLTARRVGTEISVLSSNKRARNYFSRSAHVLIKPTESFMNHSKAIPLRMQWINEPQWHRSILHTRFGIWGICVGSTTLYRRKYVGLMPWIWEGRESCPILLGRVGLSPHIGDRLGWRGPQGVAPICSSSWNDCFHFLSYPPL